MQITFGSIETIESYRDPSSDEPDRLRVRALDGEQITTVDLPDAMGLQEAYVGVVGAMRSHLADGASPVWIECPSDGLRVLLFETFNLAPSADHRPSGWGDPDAPVTAGASAPRRAKRTAKKAAKAAETTTSLLMLVVWVALIFGFTRLALRTVVGRDWQARVMGDPNANGAGTYHSACFMGLTSDATAPSTASTALTSEVATGSLARKQCLYSHTNGTATYNLTGVFTFDQQITIRKLGVFTSLGPPPAGVLVYESLLNDIVVGQPGDQTTITDTVTI